MPTDEQRALWAAIRAHPDDDTPRLIYADWLQERGDEARAEFIRVQCALAQFDTNRQSEKPPRERGQLALRSDQLLGPNRRLWTEQFMSVIRPIVDRSNRDAVKEMRVRRSGLGFRRGFLAPWLRPAEAKRVLATESELEPIDGLGFGADGSDADRAQVLLALGESVLGRYVTSVNLPNATDTDLRALAAGARLTRLERLTLHSGSVTDTGACALSAWPAPGRITYLALRDHLIGDSGAAALARSPLLSVVSHLMLDENHLGDGGAIALAESPYLSHLRSITVTGNPIGPAGLERLWERFGNRVYPRPEPG
jgi:uncharacterized protein (TIGR02996 family)